MNKPSWHDHHLHDVDQLTPTDDSNGYTVERVAEIAFIAVVVVLAALAGVVALELAHRIWVAV